MKILFTCGGTAGHINPALGVAGRLKKLMPDTEVLFIGAKGMMETELVPREGYEIKTIAVSNLSRSVTLAGLKHNPVLRAAHTLGIPTLVHESNAVPGLTTKLLAYTVDCVMVGFENAGDAYPSGTKVVFTGTPVREGFENIGREEARRRLGIPTETPLLLSVWGSLGSDHMNGVMADFAPLAASRQDFLLIHSAGKRGYQKLMEEVARRDGGDLKARGVDLREYIFDMPLVMAASDHFHHRHRAPFAGRAGGDGQAGAAGAVAQRDEPPSGEKRPAACRLRRGGDPAGRGI